MRSYVQIALIALLSLMPLYLAGCDGEGLVVQKQSTAGDRPPNQDGGDNGGDDGGSTNTAFTGTWVASYGDDFVTSLTGRGAFEYATVLRLSQSNSALTGNGYMYRFARQGAQAWNRYVLTVQGQITGGDGVLTLRPSQGSAFDASPVWYVRLAGSRIEGMYQETSSNGSLIRGGHATWLKTGTGTLANAWAAAMSDRYAVAGEQRYDRTASVSLTTGSNSTVDGEGSMDVQTNDGPVPMDFTVVEGGFQTPDIGFYFGGFDLEDNQLGVLGFFTGSAIVGAYGEFSGSDSLLRLGHTTWYPASEPTTGAVNHDWVVSFSDNVTAGNVPAEDCVAIMSLRAQDGGAVTGSGSMRIDGDNTSVENFTVSNGSLVGSRLHLEMRNVTRTLVWDLRVAGSLMVGSYRQIDGNDRFVSRGTGEWRIETTPNLKGSWTAAYFDTFGASTPESTQLVTVNISRVDTGGILVGTGGLRFAGESRRRLFNVDGDVVNDEIIWEWRSQDLFGITTWHLRQAGNFLYGTYINEDSAGNLEFRGNARWIRTSTN